MTKFTHVIVRRPCRALTEGISSGLYPGKPDYELALRQHDAYIEALKKCGVEVEILPADERYPDSCFVEDPAVLTGKCAIITNPGAPSRNGEKDEILSAVRKYYTEDRIERIRFPGTLEGGDVMMVGDHFYVGRSERTNEEGIRQLREILRKLRKEGCAIRKRIRHSPLFRFQFSNNGLIESSECLIDYLDPCNQVE